MKLANNFLSATALAATSEAVAFGVAEGLDMATMLEVLNGSSGRSAATSDKFPQPRADRSLRVGVHQLAHGQGRAALPGARSPIGARPRPSARSPASMWERFAASEPGADFTRIYPFVCTDPGTTNQEAR